MSAGPQPRSRTIPRSRSGKSETKRSAKPGLDLEAVRATVGEKLARFKHPRRYEIVAELPRNTMGKVQKAQLRETFKDSFLS